MTDSVEVVRRMLGADDGVDLKRVYEDDAAWSEMCERLGPVVHDDCVFAWMAPGTRVERVGVEGFRAGWREWFTPFEEYRSHTEEIRPVGDGRVLVLVRQVGKMPGGADVELQAAGVARVTDGRIAAVEYFATREDALAAIAGTTGASSGA